MNSNWRTPEEARELQCAIMDGFTCMADSCALWRWRPCPKCKNGWTVEEGWASGSGIHFKQYIKCPLCNGTGHDGSGLGRCGFTRG